VHLADGCSGYRLLLELAEKIPPLFSKVGNENLVSLPRWHVVGPVLDALQYLLDSRGQHL
jgi:hypothetical protein